MFAILFSEGQQILCLEGLSEVACSKTDRVVKKGEFTFYSMMMQHDIQNNR